MQNKLSVFIGTLRVNQGVTTPSTNGFSVANVIRVTSGARSRRSILNSVAAEHGSNSHVPLRLTAVPFFNYFHAKPIYWTLRAAPLSCRRENRSQVRSAWGSVERFHHNYAPNADANALAARVRPPPRRRCYLLPPINRPFPIGAVY